MVRHIDPDDDPVEAGIEVTGLVSVPLVPNTPYRDILIWLNRNSCLPRKVEFTPMSTCVASFDTVAR